MYSRFECGLGTFWSEGKMNCKRPMMSCAYIGLVTCLAVIVSCLFPSKLVAQENYGAFCSDLMRAAEKAYRHVYEQRYNEAGVPGIRSNVAVIMPPLTAPT